MRIVGGELKGRSIKVPKSRDIRPSTEKIRAAIFSVLGGDIDGARVADLFCGSGALGLEALSRGASYALFIDNLPAAAAAVRKNLLDLGADSRCAVRMMDVFHIRPGFFEKISIIFADPPYGQEHGDRLISLLCLKKIASGGILVLEHESGWNYDGQDLKILKRLDFGDSSVSFFRLPAPVG